jgi:hypothetical protein
MRRLLEEDIDDVTSTDGIDVVIRKCKIRLSDGKWILNEGIFHIQFDSICFVFIVPNLIISKYISLSFSSICKIWPGIVDLAK